MCFKIMLCVGDQLRVSDPQGTFDAARLDGVSDVLLLAAGTGELHTCMDVNTYSTYTCSFVISLVCVITLLCMYSVECVSC